MANNYRYYTIEYQFINGRLLPNGKKIYNLGYMQQGDSYTNVLRVKIPDEYSSSVGSVLVNIQRPDKTKVANGLYLTYNAVDGYYERKLERWFTEMSGQYDLDVSVVQATSIDSGEKDELGNSIMISPLDMAGRVTYYVNESSYTEVGEELLPAVEDEFRTAISSLDASKINKDGTNSDIGKVAFQTDIEQTVAEGEIGYDNSDNEFHFGKSDGGVDKFSNKVDKVEGKALSTNDYTDLEQTKLGTIEENAEVNIIEVIKDSASTPLEVASEDRSVTLTKSVVGLGNVDNTSDTDKPISTSQQGALDTKPSIATFDGATGTVSFYKETSLSGGETPLFTVDLPTEALVVSGAYDAETEIITLTLANGSTIEIDASGLINANELVDAIATKLGLDFSALNAMGTIDTGNDLVAVRDVSGTAETKKVSVKNLVESAGVMKDISQLDSATIDDNDYMLVGEGSVPKKATVGELKSHIIATTGTFDPTADYAPNGLGAYESAVLDVQVATYVADGDFKVNIKEIETNKVLYVKFPATSSTYLLRFSTDNGANYKSVYKNGLPIVAYLVSDKTVVLRYDGTNFIAEVQSEVSIETTNAERIESTYCSFVPHIDGAPLIKEIQGLTIGACQLTLDTPITELNNHTLREVFEDILIDWNRQLPNGIFTYQERLENGAYVLDRYVQEYTLQASDIGGINTVDGSKNDWVYSKIIIPDGFQNVSFELGHILVDGKIECAYSIPENSNLDLVENRNKIAYSYFYGNRLYFIVAKGTYATVGEAQADLAATKIWYQLATPILNVWSSSLTVAQLDYYYSLYQELIDLDGGLPAQYSNGIYTNDDAIIYGTPLITAKQYSPMFDTTFDLMSEANIKSQFDLWVQENILPHDLQSLTNATIKSVGKNLFDGQLEEGFFNGATGAEITYVGRSRSIEYITVNQSKTYIVSKNGVATINTAILEYDNDYSFIKITYGNNLITTANTKYLRLSFYDNEVGNNIQLEQGTVATAYEPYKSETQVFNATIRSAVDNGTIRDKIRYDNGKYVIDRYVDTSTGLALATPLLANETVDVDGTIIQDSVTTLYQEQDLSTVYKVEWSMNAEQSVVTLVQRDKMQQEEIDELEDRLDEIEPKAQVNVIESISYNGTPLAITEKNVDIPKEAINISSIDTVYADIASLPSGQSNGTVLPAFDSGTLKIFQYNGTTEEWEEFDTIRPHTIYVSLNTNKIYRYTMASPYFLELSSTGLNEYGSYGIVTNIDTITKTGFYTCDVGATGVPDDTQRWFVMHQNSNAGTVYATQRAVMFDGDGLVSYERYKDTTWSAWVNTTDYVRDVKIGTTALTKTDGSVTLPVVTNDNDGILKGQDFEDFSNMYTVFSSTVYGMKKIYSGSSFTIPNTGGASIFKTYKILSGAVASGRKEILIGAYWTENSTPLSSYYTIRHGGDNVEVAINESALEVCGIDMAGGASNTSIFFVHSPSATVPGYDTRTFTFRIYVAGGSFTLYEYQ